MDFRDVYRQYEVDLRAVEATLKDVARSDEEALQDAALHLLQAGGKRIRPLFALLCARVFGPLNADVVKLAAALEMIHMATLVHDDVIDDASLRRGHPTVRHQFGDRAAMYTGDSLFAKAILMLSDLENPLVHQTMSSAIVRMCEGEIDQIQDFFNWSQSLRNYLRRVERKTALLISVSCELGAVVAGAPQEAVRHLRRFGYYTGMAFQITDDILDYEGEEAVVGKPVGGDLRQGNLTLPALAAAAGGEPAREELISIVREGMSVSHVQRAIEIVKDSNAVSWTKQCAFRYMDKAMSELEFLPPSPAKEELAVVARFVNQRMY